MPRKNATALVLAVLAFLPPAAGLAAAQGAQVPGGYAEIVFVQGGDLTLLRGGKPLPAADPMGMRLLAGDELQTGARTQVELLLKPRLAAVKISENTVVVIRDLSGAVEGATGLQLVYGRIRSKVEKLAAGSTFNVSGGAIFAGVRGTDFGCDIIAPRGGSAPAPVSVYCFEGSLRLSTIHEAVPAGSGQEAEKELIVLGAGGMAVLSQGEAGEEPVFEARPIDAEILGYWAANEFTAAVAREPGLGAIAVPPARGAAPPAAVLPGYDQVSAREVLKRKNAMLASGAILAGLGGLCQAASAVVRPSDAFLADLLSGAGAGIGLAALPVLFISISLDPFAPASAR